MMTSKSRILVVDDDSSMRSVLHDLLTSAGYEVVKASNGTEGLQLYRAHPTDLVIMDVLMPEKDGFETIMELRQKFPTVRIVALSGGSRINGSSYLLIASKLGAQQTLPKPFNPDELLRTVREGLTQEP